MRASRYYVIVVISRTRTITTKRSRNAAGVIIEIGIASVYRARSSRLYLDVNPDVHWDIIYIGATEKSACAYIIRAILSSKRSEMILRSE